MFVFFLSVYHDVLFFILFLCLLCCFIFLQFICSRHYLYMQQMHVCLYVCLIKIFGLLFAMNLLRQVLYKHKIYFFLLLLLLLLLMLFFFFAEKIGTANELEMEIDDYKILLLLLLLLVTTMMMLQMMTQRGVRPKMLLIVC